MKKRELLTLLGYAFEGEPENQAMVCLAVAIHKAKDRAEDTLDLIDDMRIELDDLENTFEREGIVAGVAMAMGYAPKPEFGGRVGEEKGGEE